MPKVRFGDIARECRETFKGSQEGLPVVGLEHLEPEQIQLTAWGTCDDNTFNKAFHKGQVLFGRRRAYLKKAAQAPFDGICSGDITVIEAIDDQVLPELLPFIVQNDTFFDYAVSHSAGGLSPRVKWEHLRDFEFALPDLPTQQKLANLLWAMERTKTAYKDLIAKTDELVKSQFIEMFGDPYNNPKGWDTRAIDSIMRGKVSNGFFAKPADYCDDGNAGIICVGDVVNRKYSNITSLRRANATDKDFEKFSVQYGDALFCRSSLVKEGIGKASIIPENTGTDVVFECHVIRVPLNTNIIVPEFFQEFTVSDYFREQMINKSKTATMTTIGQKDIVSTEIFVPPIDMQREFKKFSGQIDKSKFAAQQALESLTAAQKSIMRQYLG